MQKHFIQIVSHMRILEKVFQNDDLVVKVLIWLNYNWNPKVTLIYESMYFSFMDLALFSKLQEHEMKLKRIADDEEADEKKETITLKTKEKYSDSSDEETMLIVQNFKSFMKSKK